VDTKGQFWVAISVVRKRQFWVVLSVVKRGSDGWLLVWLHEGSFFVVISAVIKIQFLGGS